MRTTRHALHRSRAGSAAAAAIKLCRFSALCERFPAQAIAPALPIDNRLAVARADALKALKPIDLRFDKSQGKVRLLQIVFAQYCETQAELCIHAHLV